MQTFKFRLKDDIKAFLEITNNEYAATIDNNSNVLVTWIDGLGRERKYGGYTLSKVEDNLKCGN